MSARLAITVAFAILALGLIGYSAYRMNEEITNLEFENRSLRENNGNMFSQFREFETYLNSLNFNGTFETLVTSTDEEERRATVDEAVEGIEPLLVRYGVALEVSAWMRRIAFEESEESREQELDSLFVYLREEAGIFIGPPLEPVVVEPPTVDTISTIVTIIGGLVSAAIAIATFFVGGTKRSLQDQMLSLEIEMKRLEIEKAKRALGAQTKATTA
ncbi:MAG: hypothetical protein AAF718_09585 [Pseudomonadota bacterium]